MNAFAAAVDVMFADPHMTVAAIYRVDGIGEGTEIRVYRSAPDVLNEWAATPAVTRAVVLGVRLSDAPDLSSGDTFEIAGSIYKVQGSPRRDPDRLTWTAEVAEQ